MMTHSIMSIFPDVMNERCIKVSYHLSTVVEEENKIVEANVQIL